MSQLAVVGDARAAEALVLGPAENARLELLDHLRLQANAALAAAAERLRQTQAVYAPLSARCTGLAAKDELTSLDGRLLQQWERGQEALAALEATQRQAQEAARAAAYEYQAYGYWLGEAAKLAAQLRAEYVGTGPQYEILIRRLVQAEIRARQLEALGTGGGLKEHALTVANVLKLVQALQKYQEGLGSDAVRKEVREGIMAALRTLEPEIQPQAPQAWARAIKRLRNQLMGEGSADPAASA